MADPVDINTLSDEDFLNLDESAFIVEDAPEEEEEPTEAPVKEPEEETLEEDESTNEPEESSEIEPEETPELSEEESVEEEIEETSEEVDEPKEEPTANAEDFFKEVTKPFKANGIEHEITDPEDVVRLMKMGLGYAKKMADIKPQMKVIKMLQKNDLLDESKLSYLIDLDKKDPAAISKLVKDAGVDAYSLESEDNEYSPKSYAVSDEEVQLEDVIADVKESETGSRTLSIIGDEWDNESKQILASNPQLIKVINEHVITGQYDQIAKVVAKERALGKLDNLSDLQAYDAVGKYLAQQGQLVGTTPPKAIVKPKAASKPKIDNSQRKKAASIGSTSPKKTKKEFDPNAGSDDDFLKQFNQMVL